MPDAPQQHAASSAWLVALVVVLLMAVLGLGGFMAYGMLTRTPEEVAARSEVERLSDEVKHDPSDPAARVRLAYALQAEGRFKDAEEAYRAALGGEPNNLAALYNRGVCLLELGDDEQAERVLLRVLDLAPEHALAAVALGDHYLAEKRYADVVKTVTPAAESHGEIADLHAILGAAYERSGRIDDAKREYEKAISSAPQLELAVAGLARIEERK